MKQYEHIIIGFGKGGKTLAGALAKAGKSVALIERSEKMYGGSCINVACIPSKALEHQARLAPKQADFAQKAAHYAHAVAQKRKLTAALREKNLQKLLSAGVDVIVGEAAFTDAHHIAVTDANGAVTPLEGQYFYLNTGAGPFVPTIPGIRESAYVYTSESLMELDTLPEKLVILGGGYIGLEFASYYANFGAQVTILQDGTDFLPREDAEIAQQVLQNLEVRGVTVMRAAKVRSFTDSEGGVTVAGSTPAGEFSLSAQAVLVATGRRPAVQSLQLTRAGVALTERGAVAVDETLRTSVPHIFAMGDVAGGLQFTYISLDDSRIVKSQLLGDGSRTTQNRGEIPYSVFLDPPFSRVGLTEQQAAAKGYHIQTARMPAAAIPKAQVVHQPAGMLKVIVDADTQQILGAHLFCAESHEMINLVKMAMDAHLPYPVLRDAVYTHPTMTEAFNDLFAAL